MIGDIGAGELILILFIVLILFGANRIPELAKGLGKGIREFKQAMNNATEEIKRVAEDPPKKPTPPPSDEQHG